MKFVIAVIIRFYLSKAFRDASHRQGKRSRVRGHRDRLVKRAPLSARHFGITDIEYFDVTVTMS